jgi:hypothetical protein
VRKDGAQCRGKVTASGYCFAHGPNAAAARAKGGAGKGNVARAAKLMPERLHPVLERLADVYKRLDAGDYDRKRATAMAQVAGILVRIVQVGELEAHIRDLERRSRMTSERPNG